MRRASYAALLSDGQWRPPAHTPSVSPAAAAAVDPAGGCTATPRCRLPAVRCTGRNSAEVSGGASRVQFRPGGFPCAVRRCRDGSHHAGLHRCRLSPRRPARLSAGADFIRIVALVCWLGSASPAPTTGMHRHQATSRCPPGAAGGNAEPLEGLAPPRCASLGRNKLCQRVMQKVARLPSGRRVGERQGRFATGGFIARTSATRCSTGRPRRRPAPARHW